MVEINRVRTSGRVIVLAGLVGLLAGGVMLPGCATEGGEEVRAGSGAGDEVPPEIATATFAEESCCLDDGPCQDGLWCNGRETCNCWGECEGADPSINICIDGDPCTDDTCDDFSDVCPHTPLPGPGCGCTTDAFCNDGDECTVDVCDPIGLVCTYSPTTCDDGNLCTDDSCDPAIGCINANNTLPCDDGQYCTIPDTCGGGTCSGTPRVCPDPDGLVCTPDVCNEATDTCDSGLAAGYCLIAGVCYLAGATNPGNQCQSCQPSLSTAIWSPKANGTACNDGQFCTLTDACNGGICAGTGALRCPVTSCVTGCNEFLDVCTFAVPGAPCRDGQYCNGVETCNGAGLCLPGSDPCTLACESCNEMGDVCDMSSDCRIGGACYDAGATNPANQCQWCAPTVSRTSWSLKPAGTACNDGLFCSATEACNAAGACAQVTPRCPAVGCVAGCNEFLDVCTPAPAGTVCAGAAGTCELNGVCNGTALTCPGTTFRPSTYVCRASGGVCDVPENCTGSSAVCPANVFRPSTYNCRASADVCDLPENCTGSAAACPANVFRPNTYNCRAAVPGGCDLAENCTGTTAPCPADVVAPVGTVCRAAAGVCDVAESCTGTNTCPANVFQPTTVTCRGVAGPCDVPEYCPGGSALCPGNGYRPAGFICRASAGPCDLTETCPGGTPACPGDAFAPSTTVCRSSIGSCDQPENCTGAAAACPLDVCRPTGTTGYCAADAYSCTIEPCNGTCGAGAVGCTTTINTGCLIGGVCYAEGTVNPSNICQACLGAISRTAWSNRPAGSPCTPDTHTCTTDQCNGAGVCTHPITSWATNDTCNGSALTQSGTGGSMYWTGSGDTYCGRDNYTSTCGGDNANGDTIGPDLVHYFDIPTEYAIYRYRVETAGPASFNPVQYYYQGSAGCGLSGSYYRCSDVGSAACWSYAPGLANDGDDACQHYLYFPEGRNYVVADSQGAGGNYNMRVDRRAANTGDCSDPPLPEMQLGGTYRGNTCTATTYWGTNMPYCVAATYSYVHRFNFFHLNHATPPFNTLNRGYVAWVDGTVTPSGMDTTLFFAVNQCSDPWYLFSCDDDTYHLQNGSVGFGSKIASGRVPPGWWAGFGVTQYSNSSAVCGQYTLRVELDEDGDGIPNGSDGSNALMRGATATVGGEGGAKQIPTWPWADHGESYQYPNNSLTGLPGREVYYSRVTTGTTNMRVRLYPRIRGDVWYGAGSYLWDAGVWVYTPTSVYMYCRGYGWFWSGAGVWRGCDIYGDGGYEEIYLQNAPAGTYRFAVDAYYSTPRGGWYSIEFIN